MEMEPHVSVNGRPARSARSAATSRCWTGCADAVTPAARRAARRASAAPAPCMVARPDGWFAGTRWTAINACLVPAAGLDNQEVITAEGLGDADGCTRCSARWPTAVAPSAVTAHRVSSARWPSEFYRRGPLRPATGGRQSGARRPAEHRAGQPAAGPAAQRSLGPTAPTRRHRARPRPRARPERLRPARAVREPVPLHRVPADPGRRLRARRRRRSPTRCSPAVAQPAPAPVATRITSGQGRPSSGRRTWPRRWTCWPRTRTRSWSPAPPTGASS